MLDKKTLRVGFYAGVLLAFACLLLCLRYFFLYESHTNAVITLALEASNRGGLTDTQQWATQLVLEAHMYTARVLLLSCGVLAGTGFGFLGFALFLIGIDGSVDATATGPGGIKLTATHVAPGAFVLLCSAVLIGVCASVEVPVRLDTSTQSRDNPPSRMNSGGLPQNRALDHLDKKVP